MADSEDSTEEVLEAEQPEKQPCGCEDAPTFAMPARPALYADDYRLTDLFRFMHNVQFFFELLRACIFGALVGWLIGTILKALF